MSKPSDLRRLEVLLRDIQADAQAIELLLTAASEAQWMRSPTRGEPIRVKSSIPSDMVGDTVVDPRRLHVRQAMKEADRRLVEASARVRGTRAALERGMRAWEGGDR